MKNSLLLLISLWATTVFAKNPVYLDANGVTIKAHEWAKIGDKGVVNGVEYIVADRSMLDNALKNNEPLSNYCTSRIASMLNLFMGSLFNGDISKWDVSNVTDMWGMFAGSKFNGDISKWDVRKVVECGGFSRKATNDFPKPKFNKCVCNCQ
jgi:surface protein